MNFDEAQKRVDAGFHKTETDIAAGMLAAGFPPAAIAQTVAAIQRGNHAEREAFALVLTSIEGRPQ